MSGPPRRRPTSTWTTALASVRRFAALQPSRLLFSHYGPVTQVSETLDRSAEEIIVWVEETRQARAAGLDLDHAVAMVRDRTKAPVPGDQPRMPIPPSRRSSSGSAAPLGNVEGIMHWLGKTEQNGG